MTEGVAEVKMGVGDGRGHLYKCVICNYMCDLKDVGPLLTKLPCPFGLATETFRLSDLVWDIPTAIISPTITVVLT